MTLISFNGFIRDIIYTPHLTPKLKTYDINNFNINSAKAFGKISLDSADNYIAFSKWVSPKRTRSYPFARIYNIYHLNSKRVTVIPIMKDEGMDGDNDRINFIRHLVKIKYALSKTLVETLQCNVSTFFSGDVYYIILDELAECIYSSCLV